MHIVNRLDLHHGSGTMFREFILFPFDAHPLWLYCMHETLTRTWDFNLQ